MNRLLNKDKIKLLLIFIASLSLACNGNKGTNENHDGHTHDSSMHMEAKNMYTCPMPEDSVFSDKPGACPKCGMELMKVEKKEESVAKIYTCPMHPQIIRDKPGQCPICGMDLVERGGTMSSGKLNLGAIIEPVNETVIGQAKTIVPVEKTISEKITAKGYISYNPRNIASVSSRYSGRIDKLYVKYNFQEVRKGQKIMDIYSPDLLTAQQNFVFLLNSNEETTMVDGARQRLLLLGMNEAQMQLLSETRKPEYLVSIYAPSSGHIHQMGNPNDLTMNVMTMDNQSNGNMATQQTATFNIREGMYVKKGEAVFNIINLSDLWVILKIYPQDIGKIKVGQPVEIVSEIAPDSPLMAKISFIEPVLEKDSKFLSARVYLEKCDHHVFKIGSLVNANIQTNEQKGLWIPSSSVLDLGNGNSIVFKKEDTHFRTFKISIGDRINGEVKVLEGLSEKDSIASDAYYMIDSESFVLVK